MTHDTKRVSRRAALPAAAIAVLLLAGCSTGHIGETWQCPLAAGGSCDSVAAADPAVPAATGGTVLGEPLWRVREGGGLEASAAPSCAAECDGGFDPFAWLARLFGGNGGEGDAIRASGETGPASADTGPDSPPDPAAPPPARGKTELRPADPGVALLPAQHDPAQEELGAGDLRTGEVVARIWIAPFVDAGGVYREASHVRVVLEPAGWRLK